MGTLRRWWRRQQSKQTRAAALVASAAVQAGGVGSSPSKQGRRWWRRQQSKQTRVLQYRSGCSVAAGVMICRKIVSPPNAAPCKLSCVGALREAGASVINTLILQSLG